MIGEGQIVIKQFLEQIRTDILNIDGGCAGCIKEFCDGVNETLEHYNLKLVVDDDSYPITLSIEETD